MNLRILPVLLCLFACLAGCGRAPTPSSEPSGSTSPTTEVPAEAPSATVDSPPATAASEEKDLATVLSELTQAVRRYGVEQRRAPRNLDDLVAGGYLTGIPAAPAGKKFAIDKNLQVIVANQ
jgi:hypothetical protein